MSRIQVVAWTLFALGTFAFSFGGTWMVVTDPLRLGNAGILLFSVGSGVNATGLCILHEELKRLGQ